jgi:hypothetical protein
MVNVASGFTWKLEVQRETLSIEPRVFCNDSRDEWLLLYMAIASLGPNFGLRVLEGQNETSASRFKLENIAGCVGRPEARDIPFLGFFLEEERVCF